MIVVQDCLGIDRRADRRGGLTERGPQRGAVVPVSLPGQSLARVGGVMRWRNLPGCLVTHRDSFDVYQSPSNTSALHHAIFMGYRMGYFPPGRFGLLLPFWLVRLTFLVCLNTKTSGRVWPIDENCVGGAQC